MSELYTTISYQAKMEQTYKVRIRALLKLLPPYCRNFQRYLKTRCTLHTCMQYLGDVYTFYRYLSESNPMIKTIGIRSTDLATIENLSKDEITAYQTWLRSYKFESEDESETEKNNSATTQRRKFISLRIFFSYLQENGKIKHHPMEEIPLPRAEKSETEDAPLSQTDLYHFFHEIETAYQKAQERLRSATETDLENTPSIRMRPAILLRDQVMTHLILDMGLYVSELCALNCADIIWESKTLRLPLTQDAKSEDPTSQKTCFFSEKTLALLKTYVEEERELFCPNPANYDALFLGNKRSRITPRSVERVIKAHSERALGKEKAITPRKLRLTALALQN